MLYLPVGQPEKVDSISSVVDSVQMLNYLCPILGLHTASYIVYIGLFTYHLFTETEGNSVFCEPETAVY